MTVDHVPEDISRKHWELMARIARRPAFCCGCFCIPREDRRRARRVFRLTRKVIRAWDREQKERAEAAAAKSADRAAKKKGA